VAIRVKFFPYDLTLSYNTSITDGDDTAKNAKNATQQEIPRLSLHFGRYVAYASWCRCVCCVLFFHRLRQLHWKTTQKRRMCCVEQNLCL